MFEVILILMLIICLLDTATKINFSVSHNISSTSFLLVLFLLLFMLFIPRFYPHYHSNAFPETILLRQFSKKKNHHGPDLKSQAFNPSALERVT